MRSIISWFKGIIQSYKDIGICWEFKQRFGVVNVQNTLMRILRCFQDLKHDVMLCYIYMWYPLRYDVNETECYVCHVMSCHVKLCDGLFDDCHVYMMHICNKSWMKGEMEWC